MSEQPPSGLTQEQNEEAIRLRQEHNDRAWQLRFANEIRESGRQGVEDTLEEAQAIADSHDDIELPAKPEEHPAIQQTHASLDKIVEDAQTTYDENIEESRRHVDEHLPEYIAQAKLEAQQQGVNISYETEQDDKPAVIHGAEGFDISVSAEAIPENERVAITKEDLQFPEDFREGEALISLVCNVKDIRTEVDGELGTLYPEQAAGFRESIKQKMDNLYSHLSPEEKDKLDVVVLAGDTPLVTPGEDGLLVDQRRAVLTGKEIIQGVREAMDAQGIDSNEHITSDGDNPIAITHLRDVNMLHQTDKPNVKQFVDYLIEKYGAGRELWMAYEDDTEKDIRESLGVEGPSEIAERMSQLVNLSGYIANIHQQRDPSRRVIVFAVGHYDNISPWAKRTLMGIDPSQGFIPVEKAGGLVIRKGTDGSAETVVGGKQYPVKIET